LRQHKDVCQHFSQKAKFIGKISELSKKQKLNKMCAVFPLKIRDDEDDGKKQQQY
jgi:hypothetical protein